MAKVIKPKAANDTKTENPITKALADSDKILDGAKGKFPIVVVIGLTEGNQLDVTTNSPQYPTLQWVLSRASFELLLHEKQTLASLETQSSDGTSSTA